MNRIVSKQQFSEKVFKLEVEAPLIAKSRKAGHFVIIRVDEKGERMPLTIAGADIEKGTITLVVQTIGLSSNKLCRLNVGDTIADIVGPLGQATHIENFGSPNAPNNPSSKSSGKSRCIGISWTKQRFNYFRR